MLCAGGVLLRTATSSPEGENRVSMLIKEHSVGWSIARAAVEAHGVSDELY